METNPRMIGHAVFQGESDFPQQIPINNQNDHVYFKGWKKMFSLKIFLIKLTDNLPK